MVDPTIYAGLKRVVYVGLCWLSFVDHLHPAEAITGNNADLIDVPMLCLNADSTLHAAERGSCPCPLQEHHRQAMARAHAQQYLGVDLVAGEQAQLVALGDGRQDELGLHPGEVAADAQAGATAEWEVGKVRAPCSAFGGEALGVKHVRILPEIGMAVRRVRAEPDQRVRRDNVAADFVIGQRFAVEANGRWIEPQRLLQHHTGVDKPWEVLNHRDSPAQHPLQFRMQAALHVRVLGKQVPRPGERVRGRFMTGEQQRHDLIAHLPVVHALSCLLVTRQHQQREQVIRVGTQPTMFGDHLLHDSVERANGLLNAAVAWRRNGERWHRMIDVVRERCHQRRECLTDGIRLIAEVDAEQGLAHDAQRQAHHLHSHIHGLIARRSVVPTLQHNPGGARHERSKGGKLLAMEGGLHETPLVQPRQPVVGEESLAKQGPEEVHEIGIFAVVAMILLQHMLDIVRVKNHVGRSQQEADRHDVAIALEHGLGKAEGIALNSTRTPKQPVLMRPGRPLLTRQGRHLIGFQVWSRHLYVLSHDLLPFFLLR